MRRLVLSCVVVLAACSKPEQHAATPGTISLADLAGKWTMRTMAQGSDSVLVTYELTATADTTGWFFHFPQRDAVPVRVTSVAGDSIVTEAGPYASVLRQGVQVSVHSVMRLKDGKIEGTSVAHYSTGGTDSVVNLHTEGTRAVRR